jgi:ferric-dicitrate binding protein FerR (iron transport regulator)
MITKHTGGAPPFELGTPSAVIAVRGTQFEVEVNRQRETEVDVSQGVVEVTGRYSHRSVLVHAGSSTRVGMDSGPEEPRATGEMHSQSDKKADQGSSANKGSQMTRSRGKP